MLIQLPGPAEPEHLARMGATFEGVLPVAGLDRLRADLNSPDGRLDVALRFSMEDGVPMLRGHVGGAVELVCQRCLQPLDWPLDIDLALAFVESDFAEEQLPDAVEGVRLAEGERLLLAELLEDEALLALPGIPRHADTQCAAGMMPAEPETAAEPLPEETEEEDNPFAVLATLKGRDPQG